MLGLESLKSSLALAAPLVLRSLVSHPFGFFRSVSLCTSNLFQLAPFYRRFRFSFFLLLLKSFCPWVYVTRLLSEVVSLSQTTRSELSVDLVDTMMYNLRSNLL